MNKALMLPLGATAKYSNAGASTKEKGGLLTIACEGKVLASVCGPCIPNNLLGILAHIGFGGWRVSSSSVSGLMDSVISLRKFLNQHRFILTTARVRTYLGPGRRNDPGVVYTPHRPPKRLSYFKRNTKKKPCRTNII